MRIGYPCINLTVDCRPSRTFRLKSYSPSRLQETVRNNLDCLRRIMEFNAKNHLLFLRISSDLVPFASHPANTFDWQTRFRGDFEELGRFVDKAGMRISMHPDQFTLINSVSSEIFQRSRRELLYHVQVLDLMNLDASAKVQIHVGGAYGDKPASMERFARRFTKLDETIRRRLVVENDDRLFNVDDCLRVSAQTGVPVLFDVFHHKYNNLGEALPMAAVAKTWNEKSDGIPMMDYSSQNPNGAPRMHARTLDENDFRLFLEQTAPWDFDVMLEIKDKEKSALRAFDLAKSDRRVQVQ